MIDKTSGLHYYCNFFLLPKDFLAITLFGCIFFRLTKKEMDDYAETKHFKTTMNHERIHVLQAKSFKTRYLGFYIYYLWFWFIGLFKYGVKNNASYYQIPFEKEAFANERDFNYSQTNWKNYK